MAHYRTISAFLIAPLAVPVGLSLAAAVSPGSFSLTDFLGLLALFSLYALPPAYLFELVLGIPAWLFFRRYRIRAWSAFAAGGAVLGATYYVASEAVARNFTTHLLRRVFDPMSLWLDVPAGLASAILFRAIVFPSHSRENPK